MAGVTSSYPAALDSESNLTPPNNGDTLSVADHWLAGNSGPIVAIETELGTDPAGAFTDVKSRLDDVDDKVITEIDQWHITASLSGVTSGTFTTNWTRTSTIFSNKGTGLSESSGIFSFPSTGYYRIIFSSDIQITGGAASYAGILINYTTDNFSSVDNTINSGYNNAYSSSTYAHVTLDSIVTISDTTNQKIKFKYLSSTAASYNGNSTIPITGFTCVKIGEL